MYSNHQRTSARYRIPIIVSSLLIADTTAFAQHGGGHAGGGHSADGQHGAPFPRSTYAPSINPQASRSIDRGDAHRYYSSMAYRYGGYWSHPYYPYYYHSYNTDFWGPGRQSGDFFAPSLGVVDTNVPSVAAGAEAVVVDGMRGYYYYGGTYYRQTPSGFTVVAPIPGMTVESLPQGGRKVRIGAQSYVRLGNTYYRPIQFDGKNLWQVVEVPQGE